MGKGMRAGKKKKPSAAGGNMQQQLKQVQAMQREMEAAQEELADKEVTATSGGGAVEITVNGSKQITKLDISTEVIDPDDKEMLQDLVIAAVNEAMRQVDTMMESAMNRITGGINIPGL